MKIYIANASNQVQVFSYRVIGEKRMRTHEIPIGQQLGLPGDLNQKQIESIIEQHERYGLIDAAKVDQTKKFAGLCYNIDKPVPPPKIEKAQAKRDDTLTAQGEQTRKEAAVSAHNTIQESTQGNLKALSMSVVEDTPGKEGRIAEGVKVPRDGDGANTGGETNKQRVRREKAQARAASGNQV